MFLTMKAIHYNTFGGPLTNESGDRAGAGNSGNARAAGQGI